MRDELEEKLDRLCVLCDRVTEERTFSSSTYYCMKEELPRLIKAVLEIKNDARLVIEDNEFRFRDTEDMALSFLSKLDSILINEECSGPLFRQGDDNNE